VPPGQLRSLLGTTSVKQIRGQHQLAIVDQVLT